MSPGPQGTSLGVDFGTSHTIAVVRRADGSVRPLLFDGAPLMPSAVCADSQGLLVGRDAVHAGRRHPERFEPNPKRLIDRPSTLLGEREFPVADLIGAVLDAVAEECRRVVGRPAQVTLTVPAEWGPARRRVMEDAAARSGLGRVRLVPEPVAAACYYAEALKHRMAVGSCIVVYDLGAGTFDASVVRRTGDGFETVALDGRGDLGGLDIDAALIEHLGVTYGSREGWSRLVNPVTVEERRHFREFQEEVRGAKERLSRHQQADIAIPLLDVEAHLTRSELERIAAPHLEQTIRVTQAVVRAAGLDLADGEVFLVGGASRMPLVATMLHRAFGLAPTVLDQPEVVVAEGSVLWTQAGPGTATFPLQRPGYAPTPAASAYGPAAPTPQAAPAPGVPRTEPAAPQQVPPVPYRPTPQAPPPSGARPGAQSPPETGRAAAVSPPGTPPRDDGRGLPPRGPQAPPDGGDRPATEEERRRGRKVGRRAVVAFILVDVLIIAALVWYFGVGTGEGGEEAYDSAADPDAPSFTVDWADLPGAGEFAGELTGAHEDGIASLAAMEADGEPMLFSAGRDGTVRRWSMTEGVMLDEYAFPQGLNSLWTATSAAGEDFMIAVDADYGVHAWDTETAVFTEMGTPELPPQGTIQRIRAGLMEGAPVLALMTASQYEIFALDTGASYGIRALPSGTGWRHFFTDADAQSTGVVYTAEEYPLEVADAADGATYGRSEDRGEWTDADVPAALGVVYDDAIPYAMLYSDAGLLHFWDLQTMEPAFDPLGYASVGHQYHNQLVPTDFGLALLYIDDDGTVELVGVESAAATSLAGGGETVTKIENLTVEGHPVAVTGDDAGNIQFWSLGL